MSLKNSNNEFEKENNISLYQSELALKDMQISHLKNKINNLVQNKNSLFSQLDKSVIKKNALSSKISPLIKDCCKSNNIYYLSNDNFQIKNKMNSYMKFGDKYKNTLQYKLLSAQNEIENLTIMNENKDNIIMNMQNFINNLNNTVCNGKINLNLNQLDINTFVSNLKQLEQKIINIILKVPKQNKFPESIFKKMKINPIKKQNTEVSLIKKRKFYIQPSNQRNYSNKLYTQISINNSKASNKSTIKQNFTCQNHSKKQLNDWKDRMKSARDNNLLQKKKKFKETLKIRRLLLLKKNEMNNNKAHTKRHKISLNSRFFNEKQKTINNEMSFSRLIIDNMNGGFNKKTLENM
jgi:hypothetical protein